MGIKALQKAIAIANCTCNEAMISLFRITYFIEMIAPLLNKFQSLCDLFSCKDFNIEKIYHDKNTCVEMVFGLSCLIQREVWIELENLNTLA